MPLTRSTVVAGATDYRDREPLYPVEQEQIESLPDAFESGQYGWRDAEWVLRWYYRRHLGAYPDAERRGAEARFGDNEFDAIRAAIADVVELPETAIEARVGRLTDLSGVDVGVASAYLLFLDPDAYIVVGEREWTALHEAEELTREYPAGLSIDDYEAYLDVCRSVADRVGCDLWTLYQAVWRLGAENGID